MANAGRLGQSQQVSTTRQSTRQDTWTERLTANQDAERSSPSRCASRSLVMSLVIVPRATRVNVWILRRSPPRPAVEADLFVDGEAHDPDETSQDKAESDHHAASDRDG
jgi:hypothetical protein